MTVTEIKENLRKYASKDKAKFLQRYFKTGNGEYAEGDIFLGLTVPQTRNVAKQFQNLNLKGLQELLKSKVHEDRQVALMILSLQAKKANPKEFEKLYYFYLKNTKYVNNWDLVDGSAEYLVGNYLLSNPNCTTTLQGLPLKGNEILKHLVKSENLWERRIAIISTFAFIKAGKLGQTLKISKVLLKDKHDLIHKAIGWALREVGKKDQKLLEKFLNENYSNLPRTTLRYATERFTEIKRTQYLSMSTH